MSSRTVTPHHLHRSCSNATPTTHSVCRAGRHTILGSVSSDDDTPPTDFIRAAGRRLAAVRIALGYNQKRLADELGVSAGAIGNYEQGKRLAPPHRMARLAILFFVPMEFIYRGVRKDLPDSLIKAMEASPEAMEKLRMPVAYVQPEPAAGHLAEPPPRTMRRPRRSTLHEDPTRFRHSGK